MAQSGFTPIQLYYSTTSGNTPVAADLTNGELAINTNDGILYYKDSTGVVQVLASGSSISVSAVSAATTANITLSGLQTIDGISVTAAQRVLVKDQSLGQNNGVYVVSAGAWTRSIDCNTSAEIAGRIITVRAGTLNGGEQYATTFKSTDTLGTTAMSWFQVALQNTAVTFTDLTVTGNTAIGDADTDTITQTASYVTATQLKSAKVATNTLNLAAYDVDGAAYTNLITLTASNTPTLALISTGVGTINNMSVGASTASTGAFTTLTSTGNTTLGDAPADNITVNGTVTSNLIFTDNTYDIGATGATRPRNLFLAGNATVGGNIVLTGSLDLTDLEVTNIKAKDGTAAMQIADTTGVVSVTAAPVMTALTASQAVFTNGSKVLVSNAITGTGDVVMSTSPTLVTPALGTPTALVGTNITGTATAFTASNVTTNANLTGDVTSIGNASTLATVNSNVGAFTNSSITVNAKGLVTAASSGTAAVTSVTGTSPVVSSGGATPAISLAAAYGDTLNPYASKTANFVLAAPNGSAGVPTFRAVVATDIPTLNQNTTGTAANVTGIVAIANGGTNASTVAGAQTNLQVDPAGTAIAMAIALG